MALEGHTMEGFGQTVGPVVIALDPADLKQTIGDQLADVELAASNVFGARV